MRLRRTFRLHPALAVVGTLLVVAAGSAGIASVWTRAQVPNQCLADDAIMGTPKDEKLKGTTGDDVIFGGGGNDVIKGKGGNDVLCGRGGADLIKGGNGDDVILGGGGDDTLRGGPGDDELIGGPGHDTLFGGRDTDDCDGEVENDCEEPEPTASPSPTVTPSPTPSATASPTPTPTVPPNDKKPLANPETFSTDEDQTKNVAAPGVLSNDSDPENDVITAQLLTQPANGDVTLSANGSFMYVPDANFNGVDTFTYAARDSVQNSDPATVTVNVASVPDAPNAIPQSVTTDEDTPKVVTLTATDPDGPMPTTFKITSLPAKGNLRNGSGVGALITPGDLPFTLSTHEVTYEPNANSNGFDQFNFKANDGGLDSANATVSIAVAALNDAPTDIDLVDTSVDEEEPIGTTVGNLSIVDPDAGDTHSFSLVSGVGDTHNNLFQIQGGVLKTAKVFDFENEGPFSVRVRGADAASLNREESFTITLNNVNDSPNVAAATYSLPENSANNTAVGTPSVTDQDAAQTHTWSITAGNSDTAFAIDPSTGAITVANSAVLDYENVTQWLLTVRAEDNGSPAKADSDTVTVNLTNVNETPSDIALSNASVNENEAPGANVGNLSTIDPDAGDTHTYVLAAGTGDTDNTKFQIVNGVLQTAQTFDSEAPGDPFSIRVRTTDAGSLTREEAFTITLLDVNDAPNVSSATFSIDENSPNNTAVGTVSATDEDSPAQTLTYSITAGNATGAFDINSSTGAIKVADTTDLNYENTASFPLTVRAVDNGTPAKDDSDTITINLNDVNEAPVVNAASLSLPENSPNNTSVGTVTFSDQDGGQTHTFAITAGNASGAFQINSGTGEITVADSSDLDFDTTPSFGLTVEVTDNGTPNLSGSNSITVNLTNVNEAPTDIGLSNASVAENQPAGTAVGNLSAVDPDAGDSHSFSLASGTGDGDNSKFQIVNGVLQTAQSFDLEAPGDPFSIRVRATDAGTLTFDEVFSIAVTNVNEAPTVNAATFALDENSPNGTSVGTATLSEPDAGQTHTWAITGGNPDGAFQINSSTGEITVADSNDLDYENISSYSLAVKATDDGSPALDDSDTITINLNDANDAPDVVAAIFNLAENSPNNTSVGTVNVSDEDSPPQTMTFSITAGNASGAFQINSSTGEITVADTSDLDFETTPSFSLTVRADDNGVPSKFGTDTVDVNLSNVNEAPVITAPSPVSAQLGAAKSLTGVSIADPDAGTDPIQLTLGVASGNTVTIDTGVTNGLVPGNVTGNGTNAVTILGSQAKINTTFADANGLVFDSDPGFVGVSDTLALVANDLGSSGSGLAQGDTKNVTIQFNTPPVATDQTVTTNEDTEKTVTLAGTDADGPAPTIFKITSLPATGKLHEGTSSAGTEITSGALPYTLPADKVTYVPPLNQNGLSLETFQFKTNDGSIDSPAGVITVDVTAVDDLPVAVNDPATVLEDSGANTINVLANDTDVDGGAKFVDLKTDGTNGTVAITNAGADLTYTPNANYCNNPPTVPVDTFTYTLNGGSVGNVNVTVTCVDDLPVAVNDTKTMNEDSTSAAATTIDVLGNDTDQDGGPKTIELKTNGTSGTVAITNAGADLTYTPSANYCNTQVGGTPDTFTYTLNGGSIGTVGVTVTCVDDAPVAVNDTKTVQEDDPATTIDVLDNDTDIDAGPMFVDVKTNSTNGGTVAITNAGADLTYTPAANYCNDPELQPAGGNLVETFTYTLNGTPASVGTVTVTVTCVNDPPTADTETFNGADSALSNFRLDNGTSTSGLDIAPSTLHNVLAGDIDIEGDTITLIAGADCTGTGPFTCLTDGYDPDGPGGQPVERGTVHLETDGDFHYTPPPGHVGSDTFDYRVSDGQAANSEANGAVNIDVVGPTTWFVDDTAGAGGNGTSARPFQTFAPLTAAGASNHLDDADDTLFVYEGNYTTGIVLENGQKLLGHPHSLDISDTAGRTHTDLVSGAGTAPAISHGSNPVVTLGSGNELQDLALGNGSVSLSGTSVGTATVRDTSIVTTGKALDINTGTMDMVFSTLTSTGGTEGIKLNNAAGSLTANGGTLQNATNAVVDITGASQDVTLAGNISDDGGQVISIANTTGGTKDFNGKITGVGGGSNARINLTNNPGSIIRFDEDVSLDTLAMPAVNATGGGTLHMGSDDNVLTTTTGTPLNVVNTTIGAGDLKFDKISSSGAQNGIVLDNTGSTGNLNVTGTGPAASGGTIASASGNDANTNQCAGVGGAPAGVGIFLRNTSDPSIHSMVLNNSTNFGILGYDVSGFSMTATTLNGTHGNNENQDEGSAMFCGLLGSASVSDSVVGGGYEDSFHIVNSSDNLNRLTVSSTDFATSGSGVAGDAFNATSTGGGTLNITVNNGSTFTAARGDLFQYTPQGTASGDLVLNGNAFSNNHPSIVGGGGGITINPGGGSSNVTATYAITNNTFQNALGSAVVLKTGGILSSGNFNGTFANNQIGTTAVANSGSSAGSGLDFIHTGNGISKVQITNNTIRRYRSTGIRMLANDGDPTLRATITGNTLVEPRNESGPPIAKALYGISIEPGAQLTDDVTMCLDLGGVGGLANSLSTADADPAHGGGDMDINLVPNGNTTVTMPGYAGGADDLNAVKAYLAARNAGDGVPGVFADVSFEGNSTYNGIGIANCL